MQHQGPLHHRPQRRRVRNALLLPLIPNGIELRGLEGQLVSHLKLLPGGQWDRKSKAERTEGKAEINKSPDQKLKATKQKVNHGERGGRF
jgi:hypothetical protein